MHVSGSAYKLVNARAYHHGTMLIDARLEHLRGVLSNTKVSLIPTGREIEELMRVWFGIGWIDDERRCVRLFQRW